jgi:hypothetical protein
MKHKVEKLKELTEIERAAETDSDAYEEDNSVKVKVAVNCRNKKQGCPEIYLA